ncbi:hypothetical protein SAMD00019534_078170 [Acytostelium subglobosum LB1]|uniref:hypothetical protein n=1 Tax=Acytostelium subglobosum LB1 TaxID=1410327 RepID=UPI000644F291|nr:hypothetical protein SAMD00019534_078170 [Acytostelium subglobosum LB1]GAM24642.1 hypothetical protein SAMD00019534_078170 [Acytostelium subglobosum LB1]|eukprot:XP_012752311.1 hypothetical protein SAMD00019534_078170 [Acytostelium subglobosum LB1]
MESLFSLNPGPYQSIDAHASTLLDFNEDLKEGVNVSISQPFVSKTTGFELELAPSPLYMRASGIVRMSGGNLTVRVDNKEDVVAEFRNRLGRDLMATMVASAKLQSLKTPDITGNLLYKGNTFVSEMRASNKSEGLVGVSHLHAINKSFAVGFDTFFKPTSNLTGGSAALRYQGTFGRAPFQTKLSVDHQQMISLSGFTALNNASFAARVCLDTQKQEHCAVFGSSLWFSLKVGGHIVPITITGRTSTTLEHAVLVHIPTPQVAILINTSIKQNKPTFGLSLVL